MITLVYYDHDSGSLRYEQFDTEEEAIEWSHGNDYKAYIIDGLTHRVYDHT